MGNLFTPEALHEASLAPSVKAARALRRGAVAETRFLLGRMSVGHFELFFGYVQWLTRILGKLHRDLGQAWFDKALADVASHLMHPLADAVRRGAERGAIESLASLWRAQLSEVAFAGEDGEALSLDLRPCGSGGRLLLQGWYEIDPLAYTRLPDGTPVFCRFCEQLQRSLNRAVAKTFWERTAHARGPGFCRMTIRKTRDGAVARLFDTRDARRLVRPRCHRALERLEAGRTDIEDLLRDQHTEWRPLHDLLVVAVTALFSLAYRERGHAYLSELVWQTYVTIFASSYVLYSLIDDRNLLADMARIWHYHQATYRLREEEDRFVFELDPCGSGGRLLRGDMHPEGCFRYGSGLLLEVQEPSPLTFQRAPFPTYCIHCAATNRDQFEGKPWAFLVDGEAMQAPGRPCRQFLYKKSAPRIAPRALLAQVGLTSAKPLREEFAS